jgi:polar amino acid transport system substrate-binding protein
MTPRQRFRHLIRLTLTLAACAAVITSGLTSMVRAETLKVSTRNIEPFSFVKNDLRTGYSIELWETIAKELDITNDYQIEGSAKQMIEAVKTGKSNVAVGALSITLEREKVVDFSQPFFESGLQVLVRKSSNGAFSVLAVISKNLLNWRVASGLGIALAVMFGVSHLVWRFEHPVNKDWPRSYWQGIGESFWWTICIFLVGGTSITPIGKAGRIIATLWMFASVIAVSLLTASLSAALTVNALPGEINGPDDLYGRSVATVVGSVAESWLSKQTSPSGGKIEVKAYPDVSQSIAALKEGKVKAVVYDYPILNYQINRAKENELQLVGPIFDRANYGFAVENQSPLREKINQVMLKLNENGTIDQLKTKWFSSRS